MEDIIEFSECRQFIDTPVKRYSSGMYVKLAFSVAAHLDSEIMIMDEVLAVGDMKFQQKCLKKMKDVSEKEGRTVLYVSHNMNTIRQLCDRCVVLQKGMVVFDGDVEEAIRIYMGINDTEEFPVKYNYREYKRPYHFGQQIFVTDFQFENKVSAEFNNREIARFVVRFNSRIQMDEVYCILRIKDRSNTEKIAGCLSAPFSVEIGEGQERQFAFSCNELVEDVYCLSFEIITRDSSGNYYSYDNPGAAIPVRIINQDKNDIVWSKQYWGNIRLKEMNVE